MKLPRYFGRYKLVERIAVGGTAEIYRAALITKEGFSKTVAIKTLLPQWVGNEELSRLLIDEARVLCHLNHQAIVQVYELGDDKGTPFLAMEFVDGVDCARLLNKAIRERKPLKPSHVLHIISQVLSALAFAHERKDENGRPIRIVHRDISPSNILLSWNGETKVTDFGIAKGSHRTQLTDVGQMRGKYAYMSPEQARGEPIDNRSDIFSCGIVMYELIAACRLFTGQSDAAVLKKVGAADVGDKVMDLASPDLRSILLLALSADRDVRYQNAGEMLRDISGAALRMNELDSCGELALRVRADFKEDDLPEVPPAECQNDIVCETLVLPASEDGEDVPKTHSRLAMKGWKVAASLFIALGLLTTHPARGSVQFVSKVAHPEKTILDDSRIVAPQLPTVKGVIAIESKPSGAEGSLSLDGRTFDFVTPYSHNGIDIAEGVRGELSLSLSGYRPHSETFSLDDASNAFVREITLQKKAASKLYVGARPWGLASIRGYIKSSETPLAGVKVKSGSHFITVVHPPSGKTVSRRVDVREGGMKKCLADFRDKGSISCR